MSTPESPTGRGRLRTTWDLFVERAIIGRIEIVSVGPLSAQGMLLEGTAHRASHLEIVK